MSIKRVFLPICDDRGIPPLVETAFVLSRRFGAQLSGQFVQPFTLAMPMASPNIVSSEIYQQIKEATSRERTATQEQVQKTVEDCARRFADVDFEFAVDTEPMARAVRHRSRLADLSVLGREHAFASEDWKEVRDAALFGSGRPVFLVPPKGIGEQSLDRIVIAWDESLEAARAMAAAQAFLTKATEVHLIAVGKDEVTQASVEEVEQYLQLHYANVQTHILPVSSTSVGETLLDHASAKGDALLVMGAYGHWRWREMMFGGVTEYVLQHAETPVLMAH